MSNLEAPAVEDLDSRQEDATRKRVRHRKKLLYEKILKQMEFYFSDANLSKDRFLGQLMKSDPFVPVEIFLKFNKIRSLTQDVNDIAKAMKNSTFLELSEDKTKVKRISPMLPYDADTRTLYVESIPVTANREWLQRVFNDYGPVAYISLPKFKDSHRIKGYAFVEFKSADDVQKCLHVFTNMGCKLPTSTSPEELSSIKTFSIDDTNLMPDLVHNYEPPKKKKKGKEKKQKLELKLNPENELCPSDKVETPTEKDVATPADDLKTDMEGSHDDSKKENSAKKKTKKRSSKERHIGKDIVAGTEAPKGALWGLQVLPKCEWKALRNKYLNLQRQNMKAVKRKLRGDDGYSNAMPAPLGEVEPEISGMNGDGDDTGADSGAGEAEGQPGARVNNRRRRPRAPASPQPTATHIRFDDESSPHN